MSNENSIGPSIHIANVDEICCVLGASFVADSFLFVLFEHGAAINLVIIRCE